MKSKSIYIAGKVAGTDLFITHSKFAAAEKRLKQDYQKVINPFRIIQELNAKMHADGMPPLSDDNAEDRRFIMKTCIEMLLECDAIYLLADWQDSKGALIEAQIAVACGMEVIKEPTRKVK